MGTLSLPIHPSHHLINVIAFVHFANKDGDNKKYTSVLPTSAI
jgi:hypothetical protein